MTSRSDQAISSLDEDAEIDELLQHFGKNGGKIVAGDRLHLDQEGSPFSPEGNEPVDYSGDAVIIDLVINTEESRTEECRAAARDKFFPEYYESSLENQTPSSSACLEFNPTRDESVFVEEANDNNISLIENSTLNQDQSEASVVPIFGNESLESAPHGLDQPSCSWAAEPHQPAEPLCGLDDSNVNDTDWLPHASHSQSESEGVSDEECDSVEYNDAVSTPDQPPNEEVVTQKVSRKRICEPTDWFDVKNKKRREQGLPYHGWKKNSKNEKAKRGCQREARQMGPPCVSILCQKSTKRSCNEIGEETRKALFGTFWSKMTWDQRKVYVTSLVRRIPTGRCRAEGGQSRRNSTLHYSLKVDAQSLPVCKKMFLSTFGLREFTVLSWTRGDVSGMHENNQAARFKQAEAARDRSRTSAKARFLQTFLESLPKLPSHYCRKSTSKIYIQPVFGSDSFTAVYTEYKKRCSEAELEHVSRFTFRRQTREMNIGFQLPKKDKCDLCCSHEAGNVTDEEYQAHQTAKDIARNEKAKDKNRSLNGEISMLTQDLMAVKVCPFLTASAMYYKTKLCVHNYSIFNGATKDCHCFWFDETQCDLSADTFASLLVEYLLKTNDFSKNIVLWSDNCTYQNKCATMSNALLILSCEKNVTIFQKYLLRGHTQMEVDSVHATIERRLTNRKIFLPSDYVRFTEEARKEVPYSASLVPYDTIKKFSDKKFMVYQSIRPGRQKKGDPTVSDIKEIRYTPDGKIAVKISFEDEHQELLQRRSLKTVPKLKEIPQLRREPIKLNSRKWEDLQSLMAVVPQDCHSFYNNLPH